MASQEDQYYKNMDQVESLWTAAREKNFSDRKSNDALFAKCQEGMRIFWKVIPVWREQYKGTSAPLPSKIACYQRAIMLLEKEEKWETALELAKNAIKLGLSKLGNTDWYDERIQKIKKKI